MKKSQKQSAFRASVTNFIPASKRRIKKPKMTMKRFFEDLENRGPFVLNSIFEQFTKTVRAEMQKEGRWIHNYDDDLEFVAEYVARLQSQYAKYTYKVLKQSPSQFRLVKNGRFVGFRKEYLEYRKLYLKIRIWGLRTKRFRLTKWPLTQYPLISWRVRLLPFDFTQRYQKGGATFRYEIRPLYCLSTEYTRKEFPQGNLSQ